MIVRIQPNSSITLENADTFAAFSIAASGMTTADIIAAFEGDAELGDEEHVWIAISRLHALGAAHGGPGWRAGCDGMLVFAATKGWIDESKNSVLAHIDR